MKPKAKDKLDNEKTIDALFQDIYELEWILDYVGDFVDFGGGRSWRDAFRYKSLIDSMRRRLPMPTGWIEEKLKS